MTSKGKITCEYGVFLFLFEVIKWVFFCPQTGSWIHLDLLYVVMVILKLCSCDTFQIDKPPLLCQFLIRWSGFYLLFDLTVENFQYKHGFQSRHGRTVEKQCVVSRWLIGSALMTLRSFFHQLPAVSILWCRLPRGQYARNPEYLTGVDMRKFSAM